MKLNISCPATGGQKTIEIDDEKKLRPLYEKRIAHEINGEEMSEEFRGYVFRISGGNDLQGFPMMQGVMTNQRVRLLLKEGSKCYRSRRHGEKKRKSIRGCIVSADLSVLNLTVVKQGEQPIEGVTDVKRPRRRGPKRVSNIRKLFNLDKEDDVRKFVIRRPVTKGDKTFTKAPKIQRLVTPQRIQRKRRWAAIKRSRFEKAKADAEEYQVLLARRQQELKEKRQKRRESRRSTAAAK